jgi:hypothetical protein
MIVQAPRFHALRQKNPAKVTSTAPQAGQPYGRLAKNSPEVSTDKHQNERNIDKQI